MKRFILCLATSIALIGANNLFAGPEQLEAKDYKAMPAPIVEKECRWTGFYIGAHGGYSWGDLSFLELDESDPPFEFSSDGGFGGGQIGANLQIGSWFVIGVEGTFSGGDFGGSADLFTSGGNEHTHGHVDSDWMATVAGRVGVSFCRNHLLAYVKGGVGFTDFSYHNEEVTGSEVFNADDDQSGALVGFGLEYAFTCHWSVKLEYDHLFLDSNDVTGIEVDGSNVNERTFHADYDGRDMVQGGINFKF